MNAGAIHNIPPEPAAATPRLQFTPPVIARFSLGVMLMFGALYYLAKGREEKNLNKMITGGVLAMLSVLACTF